MSSSEATPHPNPLPSQGRGGFCRWRFQTALPPDKARRLLFFVQSAATHAKSLLDPPVARPVSFYSTTKRNPASFQAATPPLRALALG
jgi:hypothetical protein